MVPLASRDCENVANRNKWLAFRVMRKIQRAVAERYRVFLPTDFADEPFPLGAKALPSH